jgi:protein subunit release factor A
MDSIISDFEEFFKYNHNQIDYDYIFAGQLLGMYREYMKNLHLNFRFKILRNKNDRFHQIQNIYEDINTGSINNYKDK